MTSLKLKRNFRSGSHLVDWFNAVFPHVLAEEDNADTGAVSYATAVAADHLRDLGSVEVHPVIGSDESAEAQASVDIVSSLLDAHPDDSIAVLVRDAN